jgi:hypothetical protein
MTQPGWKTISRTGSVPNSAPTDTDDVADRSSSSYSHAATDANGISAGQSGDGYWRGGDGKRYLMVGGSRTVMPGAGMPLR